MSSRPRRLALTLLATLACLGCQRRVQLATTEGDSTATVADSTTVLVRQIQSSWESAAAGEDAAALTARWLSDRLSHLPPDRWKAETDALLDSVGIGAESASGGCALVVNFFARSDPGAGSWPYLFWCGPKRTLAQAIEGRSLRLGVVASRDLGAHPKPDAKPGVAVSFGRRIGGGQQPLLMAWQSAGVDHWKLAQTLGPDSLGGTGTGEFEIPETGVEFVTRTYRTPRGFDECATCPHLYTQHRFRWGETGFERVEDRTVPSPYASFVQFVQALTANDQDEGKTWLENGDLWGRARDLEWHRPKGAWRIAPSTDETPSRLVFYRGETEAYRVEFVSRGDEWVISAIEPVSRAVE